MKLATERNGSVDGNLLVVSKDLSMAVSAASVALTLQDAIERWNVISQELEDLSVRLNKGDVRNAFPFDPASVAAPLPRAWQWLDGSAFSSHAQLMQTAFGMPPIETDLPLMYQGMSHHFLSAAEDVRLPYEADGIDFEGEFGIITDAVPMGVTALEALSHIKLLVLINDWSLRNIAQTEMKTGFGWIQGKPACSMGPVAVTPDELEQGWITGELRLTLDVWLNGSLFGSVPTSEMDVRFHELVAHAARTRDLCAGTIVGSGTVSSAAYRQVGSCCIAERRAAEMLDFGAPQTAFMAFGNQVCMQARLPGHAGPLFGTIDQRVVGR